MKMAYFTQLIGCERRSFVLKGRDAWALETLILAGKRGVSSLTQPAPRWAAYVHNLRRMGVEIETIHEPHGGLFAGTHARYVLISKVKIGGEA